MAALRGEQSITSENDIGAARRAIRNVSTLLLFGHTDVTRIVTAVSELARNVFVNAGSGVMRWVVLEHLQRVGLELTFEDHGPGIADVKQAMLDGYSTTGGLGMGLPGTRRLMDELEIVSTVGMGTTVTVRKWRH